MNIIEKHPNTPDALMMIEDLSKSLEAITGSSGKSSFNSEDVTVERSVFVVAYNDDLEPIGCGAIRPINETTAEVKRMFAKAKGAGVGTEILNYLENKAKELGYSVLRLETRLINKKAVTFYDRRGYNHIPNYGKYANRPEAVCFEKHL